ncbi:MAG TPA: ABC transporter permease [Candidatus Limnocylindrales bacterium]|jgi:NitT/TauT family transport system permease protein
MSVISTPTPETWRRRPGRRGRGGRGGFLRTRTGTWLVRAVTFAVVIGVWQVYGSAVNRALFAPASAVAAAAIDQLTGHPSILEPLVTSFAAFFLGTGIGVLVGIPLGLLVGRSRSVEFVLDPYVTFLYVIPSVAFVPLFVLWFGFDFKFQTALVVESTIFPMMINAAAGAKNVEADLVDGGRSFGASQWQIMRTIILPGSLPLVFAGLRIAFSSAWVGVVVAQMTGALTGLGGLIKIYSTTFQTANMLVPILVIMAVGVLIHALTSRLLVRLTPWHQPDAEMSEENA